MHKFTLRFEAENNSGIQTVSFYDRSTAGALDTAKRTSVGEWAELSRDGVLLCRLRLIEETGVWFVQHVDPPHDACASAE